jgi:hypothetical protein
MPFCENRDSFLPGARRRRFWPCFGLFYRDDGRRPSGQAGTRGRSKGDRTMREMDELFAALGRSAFRSRFRLGAKEAAYLEQRGIDTILVHARQFVESRLADAEPANDGKQTPMRNHPVFIAQHATATCCRGCLAQWHGIGRGQPLSSEQIDYIVQVIELWLRRQPL